jgi:hypothetical protein
LLTCKNLHSHTKGRASRRQFTWVHVKPVHISEPYSFQTGYSYKQDTFPNSTYCTYFKIGYISKQYIFLNRTQFQSGHGSKQDTFLNSTYFQKKAQCQTRHIYEKYSFLNRTQFQTGHFSKLYIFPNRTHFQTRHFSKQDTEQYSFRDSTYFLNGNSIKYSTVCCKLKTMVKK